MKKAQKSNRLKVIITIAVINLLYRPNDDVHATGLGILALH